MSTELSSFAPETGRQPPPLRSPRRPLPWRSAFVTIVLAGLAAFAGARLGSHQAPVENTPLSERIFGLLGDGIELSDQQRRAIVDIGQHYAPDREQFRLHSRLANTNLLRAMVKEQQFGPQTQAALTDLQAVMGNRLQRSLDYMLQVRAVLTPDQRAVFDRRVVEEAALTR